MHWQRGISCVRKHWTVIAAKIHSKMTDKRFINAFVNKGVMQENMKGIRVKLVCNEKVGLYGALLCAQSLVLSH